MWVTNANTGALTGIDFVTGAQDQQIDTGHATLAVAAAGDELMIAVGPTVDEAIADLDGNGPDRRRPAASRGGIRRPTLR